MPDSSGFILDSRLQNDCFTIAASDVSLLLLLNNRLFPWFILVPKVDETEFYQLDARIQQSVLIEINVLSGFINEIFDIDKLNIASIGNLVSQMHIHLVGRRKDDACWPDVVWGCGQSQPYEKTELSVMIDRLAAAGIHGFNPVPIVR